MLLIFRLINNLSLIYLHEMKKTYSHRTSKKKRRMKKKTMKTTKTMKMMKKKKMMNFFFPLLLNRYHSSRYTSNHKYFAHDPSMYFQNRLSFRIYRERTDNIPCNLTDVPCTPQRLLQHTVNVIDCCAVYEQIYNS